jgi:hypothetical protein
MRPALRALLHRIGLATAEEAAEQRRALERVDRRVDLLRGRVQTLDARLNNVLRRAGREEDVAGDRESV